MIEFRAVLFDLDGTLLDTIEDLTDSINEVLTDRGWPVHTTEEVKYFVGEGSRNLVLRSMPEDQRDDKTIDECDLAVRKEYAKRCFNKTRPYEGIELFLDALTERDIKMAVLSNKPDSFVKELVARLFAEWRFEVVLGARPSAPIKPDPTVPREIAKNIGVQPRECLYIGDSETDMHTAVAADMHPVGVTWGFRKEEELISSGARTLFRKPDELMRLLK